MKIQIITLFPEMFTGVLGSSMLWKARDRGLVSYEFITLRDFGLGPRRQVDDTPYGGGDGMLLKVEPLVAAIEQAKKADPMARVLLPTPRGKLYKQSDAKRLAAAGVAGSDTHGENSESGEHSESDASDESSGQGLIIICPRYEGYDERIMQWVDESICVGNYVLTGGELPAMLIIDSVVRLLPGVLGGENSTEIESFQQDDQTIEFPQYTRPEDFRGSKVPEVLLSGNHAAIEAWRKSHSRPSSSILNL
jgi:tRNA (guanine37-N1)-methyltransferase